MADNDMRDKLEKIIAAYADLQAKMGGPDVLADQKEYNRLAKEYANQGPLAKKAAEYVQAYDDSFRGQGTAIRFGDARLTPQRKCLASKRCCRGLKRTSSSC